MTDTDIEKLLRKAPRPTAPAGLKEQLLADITLARNHARPAQAQPYADPWWRRWIPALAFGMIFLTCFVLLAMQASQIMQLRRENAALRAAAVNLEQLRAENQKLLQARPQAQQLEQLRKDNRELERLRAEVAELQGLPQALAQVQDENQRLQAEQAALRLRPAAAAEDPFAEARAEAMRIMCVNHLKQIGLAARLWAMDNKDDNGKKEVLPSDFLSMSNELGAPKILVCPANAGRKPTANWAEFTPQNVSYEILSPGADVNDPQVVFSRCPLHNSVGLVDGSVQRLGPGLKVGDVDGKKKIVRVEPESAPER